MEVTLALAILLVAGFLSARLARAVHLPSVTGYLLVGILLGPSVTNVIPEETLLTGLAHFTDIALMLIAFTIGEKLDLREIGRVAKSVGWITLCEASGAFILVSAACLAIALALRLGGAEWSLSNYIALCLILGSIAMATAPAATILVFRELGASGPLTRALMAVVAGDDGLAIMGFGIATAAARALGDAGAADTGHALAGAGLEIVFSLLLGAATGFLLDAVAHQTRVRSDLLVAGLGLVLLCGEVARQLHLSPLLAGMAAGLTVVNRDRRDVRIFRAINSFEAPIYVLFFTLAGAHLDLTSVLHGGLLAGGYIIARGLGKTLGANLGGRISGAPAAVRRYLGLALVPQAGVAIGLAFLIRDDQILSVYAGIVLPVVLTSVVVNELVGPPAARFAAIRAGEAAEVQEATEPQPGATSLGDIEIVPWTWPTLGPYPQPNGHVIAGVSHPATAQGVARIAILLSHYYAAAPLAVRVLPEEPPEDFWGSGRDQETLELFRKVRREAVALDCPMSTEVEFASSVAGGLVNAADTFGARAIVLGHPATPTAWQFTRIVDAVAQGASAPVIVVRLAGALHTERILVPLLSHEDLEIVRPVVSALGMVNEHQISLLYMLHSEARQAELEEAERLLAEACAHREIPGQVSLSVLAAESRAEAVLNVAPEHDIIVMAAAPPHALRRIFFGSLAEDVAQRANTPMLLVCGPAETPPSTPDQDTPTTPA